MSRPDDFDRYADEQEYRADMMRDAQKVRHDLDHTEYVEDCSFCEDREEDREYFKARPICQDCGEPALPGYVAGDRCERLAKRNAYVPETVCGGRLDAPNEESNGEKK